MARSKTEPEIKFLIQENSKPQDLIVYTDGSVTKDQPGWGFTVKQVATAIHEDNAAYTAPTSSLTMEEVETVTHALRWTASRVDGQTTHTIILTDSMTLLQKKKSGMGNPDKNVSMVDSHPRKFLRMSCSRHAGMKGNGKADRLAGRTTITNGLIVSQKTWSVEELETLPASTKPRTPHHLLPGGKMSKKQEALDDLPWKDERE